MGLSFSTTLYVPDMVRGSCGAISLTSVNAFSVQTPKRFVPLRNQGRPRVYRNTLSLPVECL